MDIIKQALIIIAKAIPLAVGVLLLAIYLFTNHNAIIPQFDLTDSGQIGDTIGGISSPIMGLLGASLTFIAFWVQFTANKVHNTQFDQQSTQKEADKHKEKILYLIKQNRSIAENMSVKTFKGAKCFQKMFDEFRFTYSLLMVLRKDHGATNPDIKNIPDIEMLNAAYMFFYNGCGASSDPLNDEVLKDFILYPIVKEHLLHIRELNSKPSNSKISIPPYLFHLMNNNSTRKAIQPFTNLGYHPFDGHVNRLGHYFRNLYHTLDYTSKVDDKHLDAADKYELIKSIRSQLSNYEQIFIHFNSLSCYGDPVRRNDYITKYKLVKNIPLPLVDFAGDIREYYLDKEGKPLFDFEWDQIIKRS